jgi:hypothetical protein
VRANDVQGIYKRLVGTRRKELSEIGARERFGQDSRTICQGRQSLQQSLRATHPVNKGLVLCE